MTWHCDPVDDTRVVMWSMLWKRWATASRGRSGAERYVKSGTVWNLREPRGTGTGTWDRDTLPTCPPALCKLAVPHLSEIWFGATERIGCLFLETSPGSREEVNVQHAHLFWNNPNDLLQTYVVTNNFPLLIHQSTCVWLFKSLQDSLNQNSSILLISIIALT